MNCNGDKSFELLFNSIAKAADELDFALGCRPRLKILKKNLSSSAVFAVKKEVRTQNFCHDLQVERERASRERKKRCAGCSDDDRRIWPLSSITNFSVHKQAFNLHACQIPKLSKAANNTAPQICIFLV